MRVIPDRRFITATYRIQGRNGTGSAIRIRSGKRSFLVSARHVLEGICSGDCVPVRRNNNWENWPVSNVFQDEQGHDCIVLELRENQGVSIPIDLLASTHGSQGAEFLQIGFPLGQSIDGYNINNGYPLPLIKSSICAGWITYNEVYYLVFDSYSNKGFSGGPVIGYENGSSATDLRVFGIVVRHMSDSPLDICQNDDNGVPRIDGTGKFVLPNSGFMLGCPASVIRELLGVNGL